MTLELDEIRRRIMELVEEELKIEHKSRELNSQEVVGMTDLLLGFINMVETDEDFITFLTGKYPKIRQTYQSFRSTMNL